MAECRPTGTSRKTYIVLFDDLLEAGVVQLGELRQVMNIGNDVTQDLLERQEILIGRGRRGARTNALTPRLGRVLKASDDAVDFRLANLDATNDFLALDLLEVEDFVQLALKQGDEVFLVVLGPWLAVGLGIVRRGLRHVSCLQRFLEVFVGDVVPIVLLDHRRTKVFAEPTGRE